MGGVVRGGPLCYARDHPDLWAHVEAAQRQGGRSDMRTCLRYWAVPHQHPQEGPVEWASELELAWRHIEELAARLLVERVFYTLGGELSAVEREADDDEAADEAVRRRVALDPDDDDYLDPDMLRF
ncbi:MAG TPA: hypothetical protein VFD59_11090 [Nocardioidaceae bacterium]|nr:hypothetical protein [Nocardioidaceae bacterium]